ncbi:unnamed protein product [Urochloa decumbens]|uniref:GDSL esterase/lipase n=1 Tax=Urochloa decumbens TaxID=240449 RepID=A0ABC9ECL1_9POAL
MAATVLPQVMGVLLAAAAFACAAPSGSKSNNKVPALYVFGDSTADVGNNNYLPGGAAVPRANFPHNGVDFPTSRPTGRFSNGYNGVDFLAVHMGLKRSPPPFLAVANKTNKQVLRGLLGVNFASAGSGILDTTGSYMIIPLSQQVAQLASLQRDMIMEQQGQRSVFLISTGGNDLFAFFSRSNGSTDAEQRRRFISNLVSLYEEHVKALYALGARKVAVIDVPPIGCCPYPRTLHPLGACVDALNDLASAFNKGVRDAFSHGSLASLQGLSYSVGSSHAVVQSILKHPRRLGFKDVTTACCGSGRFNGAKSGCTPNATLCRNRHDYLFWDMLHPTHAASKIAAAAIYNGSTRFATPVNLRQLLEDH